MLIQHLQDFRLIDEVIRLRSLNVLASPTVKLITGQPVAHRHGEAQLLAVQNVRGNDALHRLAQRVLGRTVADLHVHRQRLCGLEDNLVQERNAQL